MTSRGNQTQLAPVAADRVSEYHAALPQADNALWKQIEESLVLSPYWFDGHCLSARVAAQLGFPEVAAAIAAELEAFLQRLPVLRELTFSDKSPFLTESCAEWLRSAKGSAGQGSEQGQDLAAEVAACRKAQGLNAALALLDDKTRQQSEPREQFYAGMMLAELLAAEGMKTLAAQHYHHLLQEAHRLGLAQWEPGLVKRLERLAKAR